MGDDDVWVFINNKLAVDLGGIHGPVSESINLDSLEIVVGETYPIKIFHAERRTIGTNVTSKEFELTVVEAGHNRLPEIASTPREQVRLGSDYLYQLEVFDPDNNPLEITLSGPIGMEIDGDGLVFWRPTAVQFGPNEVAIAIADSLGGVTRQEFTINVTSQDTNSPPSITSAPSFGAVAGREYSYNLTGTDPDGDLLLWELTNPPAGMTLDPKSGFLRWTPEVYQVGNYPIDIRLLDSRGAFTGQTFEIDVRGVNTPPIIISPPITAAAVDNPYEYQAIATDAENDILTYSLTGAVPSGMTINSATGLISWTPQNSHVGLEKVSVLVSDSLGAIASQDYGIMVESVAANLPPAITSVPIYGAAAGEVYSYMSNTPLTVKHTTVTALRAPRAMTPISPSFTLVPTALPGAQPFLFKV